jgi:hypothetical protein
MLLAQSFVKLLQLWENKTLKTISRDLIRDRVLIVSFQAIGRILQSQLDNGSWTNCYEETAYAVIALANLASLPFVGPILLPIESAIQRGREFLLSRPLQSPPEYLWIEKVSYGSNSLSKAYVLSALNISVPTARLGNDVSSLAPVHPKAVIKFSEFFSRLPLYSGLDKWRLHAALIESYLFLPLIKRVRLDIFPRKGMEEDKYLEYIPFTWTAANNRDQTYLTADYIHEMMVLSMLTYQCDEYMEAVVGRYFGHRLEDVARVIDSIFDLEKPSNDRETTKSNGLNTPLNVNGNSLLNGASEATQTISSVPTEHNSELRKNGANGSTNGHTNGDQNGIHDYPNGHKHANEKHATGYNEQSNASQATANGARNNAASHDVISTAASTDPTLDDVRNVLGKFVRHILHHPKVANASKFDQARLKRELKIYLLAHNKQTEDNARFSSQQLSADESVPFETPTSSYYAWVQSTSSDHTSCPFAFAFVSCLLSKDSQDFFRTAEEKYIGEDLCRQLAVTCRQYNDYGSVPRDRAEKNLNSINFPEFYTSSIATFDSDLKAELYRIAMFEKKKLDMSIVSLEHLCAKSSRPRVAEAVKMFVNVTDTYGQIYMIRDIASRM